MKEREDLANRLGRHPRALEFLDRLQRSLRKDGGAGFDERPWRIAEKVERRFEKKRLEDRDWERFAQDSDERTRLVLLELVSRDIMLGELLEELNRRTGSPLASLLARRMTVFRQPVEFSAFHIMIADKMRMSGKADPVREWVGCMVDLGLVQKSREKEEQRDLYASPALLSRLLDPSGPEEDPAALHRKAAGYYRQIVASNPDFVSLLRAHQGLMYHCMKAGDGPCAADAAKLLVGFAENNGMFAQARQTARTILDARLAKPPGMAQLAWLVIRSVRCGQIVEGAPGVEGELEGFVEKMKEHAGGRPETLDEESRSLYGALMHLHSQIEEGQGNYEEARRLLKESIEIKDALGDRQGRAVSLAQLGIWCANEGDTEEAEKHLKEALTVFESIDARLEMAQVRSALAPLILNEDPIKGIGLAKMAADDLRGLGHPQAVPAENQYKAMAASVQKALSEMAARMDEPHPRLIGDLGLSYLFTDEPEKAEPLLKQAMELDGEEPSMATARAALGLALVLKGKGGDRKEASRLEKLAFDIAGRFGETLPDLPGGVSTKDRPETQTANFLATVAENIFENPEEARTNVQRALAVIDQNPEMSLEANASMLLSRLSGSKTGLFSGLFALNVILGAAPDSAATTGLKKGTSGVLQAIAEKIRADLKTLTDKRASILARTMLALSLCPENPDTAKAEANKAMEEAERENLEQERTMAQMVLDLVSR